MTDPAPPRPHRPLPIDWAIAELLAGHAQPVAKGWLLLLLERAPLDAVGVIPAAALAAEGPAICAAAARALGSDVELARLAPSGDVAPLVQRIGPLAAAADPGAIVVAIDALRACLFAGALDLYGEEVDAIAVAALAERAAEIAAVLATTAVAVAAATATESRVTDEHSAPHIAASPAADGLPTSERTAPPSVDASASPFAETLPPAGPAVRDLRDGAAAPSPVTELAPRAPVDPRSGPAASMDDSELWIATLERHVDRCQREGGGLALLRVELADGDRLVASATPEEQGIPYGRLAQAIRRAIRRQDLVASDHHGRAWVIAPAVGRAGAIALAERIGAGVEHGEHWRGAPLAATIGFAVYGEDGRDAATLIDRAEEAMLAASAAGMRIGEAIPSDGSDGDRPGPRLVR
jgi:hypothetical protein